MQALLRAENRKKPINIDLLRVLRAVTSKSPGPRRRKPERHLARGGLVPQDGRAAGSDRSGPRQTAANRGKPRQYFLTPDSQLLPAPYAMLRYLTVNYGKLRQFCRSSKMSPPAGAEFMAPSPI